MWTPLVVLAIVAITGLVQPAEGHTTCLKPNEVYDHCITNCPRRECGVEQTTAKCKHHHKHTHFVCSSGCRCADGYLRNREGVCIPKDQCPHRCPKNETLDPCLSGCPPRYCGINIAAVSCLAISPKDCRPGCRCKDGFLRNGQGVCIDENECPTCANLNEVYDVCPAPCPPRRCDVDDTLIDCIPAPQPGDPECVPGCRCQDGYKRNATEVCIPADECPTCTNPNEVYDVCPAPCPPQRCDVDERLILCAPPPQPGDCECEPGCRCIDGYKRNASGICIPKEECPICTNPNEVYDGCPIPCPPRRCDVDERVISCAPPPKPGDSGCEPGCRCEDGYKRNATDICILKDECPPQCPQNETLDSCVSDCPPRYCGVNIAAVSCLAIPPENCTQGCRCKDGYLRNAQGVCISENDCPTCKKPNEVYDVCPNPCPPRRCDVDERVIRCAAPPKPGSAECEPGCRCQDGYKRNAKGICIPKDQCPKCTKPNEIYDECPAPCPGYRCDLDPRLVRCAPPPKLGDPLCEPSCRCIDGYATNNKGLCIPREECPQNKCGKNEIYSECPATQCPPINCTQVGFPIACEPASGACPGEPGCICTYGYVRNSKGRCIPKEECPSCGGDNNAKSGCDSECTKRCPALEPPKCKCYENGCECKDGFLYDPKIYKCVRAEDCSSPCGKNEVLSQCSNGGCGPWACDDVGRPTGCVKMDPKNCKVGCICREHYVKQNGVCIPATDCPECGGDPNAIYGCGINCGRLCSNYNSNETQFCIQECRQNACDCRKGYVLDENLDKCVRPKDCTPVCGKNEVFSSCVNGGCQAKYCSQAGQPVPCVRPAKCEAGCLCAEGFLRADNGTCVPQDQCPPTCGENEIYDPCPPLCPPQTCESIGKRYFCPKQPTFESDCKGACRCKPDFFRNKIGECISKDDCLQCTGPNEYFSCGGACDNVCATLSKQNQTNCPIVNIQCNRMCYCEAGYARNDSNICVPFDQCPVRPVCGKHEVYSECTNGGCSRRNCSQLGQPVRCVKLDPKSCKKGCVCEAGYLRTEDGVCVPEDECDNCYRPHEHYEYCPSPCPPQTCESIGRKFRCPLRPLVCKGACRCDDGYFRNKIGECISKRNCLKCRGPHEYFSCGPACDNVCATLYKQNQTNCPIINIKCNPMCYCEKGYARDKNNVCIPISKCPKPVCGENEILVECPPGVCQPKTCEDLGFPVACPDFRECPEPPGCVCLEDYVRDKNGRCIPKRSCATCGGDPHAIAGCGVHCEKTCALYKRKDVACPKICNYNACDCRKGYIFDENTEKCVKPRDCTPTCKENEVYDSCANGGCGKWNCSQLGQPDLCIDVLECKGGCNCKKGYLRASNDTCVPQNQCPVPNCDENERFEWCPDGLCEPKKCSELGFPIACPALDGDSECPGEPACICDYDHVRNDRGICIPKLECPSCGGDPNARTGCGIHCGNRCSNYNSTKPAICPKICKLNSCDCKKGFVFDDNTEKCVRPKDCTPKCGNNEVFSNCINGGCSAKHCSQLGKPVPCIKIDPKYCIKGCLCTEGYLRNSQGVCVLEKDCPPKQECTGQNEIYDPCPPSCPPQTCESIGKRYHCPAIIEGNKECKGACRCKPGFFRNKIGQCIAKDDCLKCTGPHEFFSCGGACDNVCATLDKQNQTNCPIVNIQCNRMCYCEQGYARNDSNICIPIDECPVCKKNERLDDCPATLCTPQKCSQLGFPLNCPASNGTCPGKPGCVCIDDYLRDENGKCIPRNSCPSCGGDHNAISGCGVNCGRHCSNYKKKGVVCPLICKLNSCDCRQGFVYDDNIKRCVRPKHCTPTCKKNEVWDTCANGGCQKRNCSQIGEPILCIDPIKCKGGCVCTKGFLRAKNGTCLPQEQCPNKCPKPHQVFDPCPRSCPPQTCESIGLAYPCPHPPPENEDFCNPGCKCEDGYYRNSIDECISEEDCGKCTGPNEHLSCGTACDNVCATLSEQNQTNCPIKNKKCVEKCYCNEGYARDANDICIPISQCGRGTCTGAHEIYSSCPSPCLSQTCESLEWVSLCPIEWGEEPPCQPGCICEDGYYRNKIRECITEQECLQCKGPHEYFSCGGACDNVCETLNEQNQTNCPIVNIQCNRMCYCEEGYARNGSNICIPIDDCPPPRCGPNQRYEERPSLVCDPLTCDEVGVEMDCPPVEDPDCEDTPACICKQGYVTNAEGNCIPISECPSNNTAVNVTEARARLDKGSIRLAGQFLYKLVSDNPDENSVASATSLLIPMAQLALWANGLLLEQLLKLLNLNNKDEIKAVFPKLTSEFKNAQDVEFEVATKYYANKNYLLSDTFKEDSKKYFDASGENIDFAKNQEAADTINDWVADQTHDKIHDLVQARMFDGNTRLCLVNAIYFLGNWVKQFNPNNTEIKNFTKSNGDLVPLHIMYQQSDFNYYENDKYQLLDMFYKDNDFSFLIALPRDSSNVLEIIKLLEDPDEFTKATQSLKSEKVQVSVPRMLIETKIDIKELLIKYNYGAMFDPNNKGFSGILQKDEDLYVSDAVQKAFINVTETGTEAAAATAMRITGRFPEVENPPIVFNADHPFSFYIKYKETVLFCGTLIQ